MAKRMRTLNVPGRPSSSPMTAKMKSLCADGSQPCFSRLAPRPTPHHPPSARANRPWTVWPHSALSGLEQLAESQVVIRPIRSSLVNTKAATTAPAARAAPTKARVGTPAAKRTAATIARRIRLVPKSWPRRTSPMTSTAIGTRKGTTTWR